ncbi:hypothetical protein TNCV_3642711 [Trichonephila clavipes]|nr:hypothetical protein TNCV_3642711 [Trichonephila clavipes]
MEGKKTSLTRDQGGRRNSDNYKRKISVLSKESSIQMDKRTKKFRQEVMGCKRKTPSSKSGGPQRKQNKGPERQVYQLILMVLLERKFGRPKRHCNYGK